MRSIWGDRYWNLLIYRLHWLVFNLEQHIPIFKYVLKDTSFKRTLFHCSAGILLSDRCVSLSRHPEKIDVGTHKRHRMKPCATTIKGKHRFFKWSQAAVWLPINNTLLLSDSFKKKKFLSSHNGSCSPFLQALHRLLVYWKWSPSRHGIQWLRAWRWIRMLHWNWKGGIYDTRM